MKYNIALIPSRPTFYKPYVQSAQRNFANRYSQYLLGKDSIPHITLCQFDDAGAFDEKTGSSAALLEKLLKKLGSRFIDHVFHPRFIGLNFLRLSSQFGELFSTNVFSVELLVQRESKLVDLHEEVASIVTGLGFEPLNTVGAAYRPHLTLACLVATGTMTVPSFPHELLVTPTAPFVVRLGLSDDHWQFAKVMTEQDN
ncbi:MAG: hypothetical protein RLZ35_499 [Pseudomonadota bacterium]|jgi:2'-5' RNA ligase